MGTDTSRTDALNTAPAGATLVTGTQTPMAACPTFSTRPRDLEQYRTACAAADGDPIEEIDACAVRQDMTVWFPDPAPGRWRPVKDCHVAGTKTVIDFLAPAPYSSSWTLASDRPVCRRITANEAPSVVAG